MGSESCLRVKTGLGGLLRPFGELLREKKGCEGQVEKREGRILIGNVDNKKGGNGSEKGFGRRKTLRGEWKTFLGRKSIRKANSCIVVGESCRGRRPFKPIPRDNTSPIRGVNKNQGMGVKKEALAKRRELSY